MNSLKLTAGDDPVAGVEAAAVEELETVVDGWMAAEWHSKVNKHEQSAKEQKSKWRLDTSRWECRESEVTAVKDEDWG